LPSITNLFKPTPTPRPISPQPALSFRPQQ
jgi:hypothetical protein